MTPEREIEIIFHEYELFSRRISGEGSKIDEIFINSGFQRVGAKIDLMKSVFGPNSYDAFINSLANEEFFEIVRRWESEIRGVISKSDLGVDSVRNDLWDMVALDDRLPGPAKEALLSEISLSRYRAALEPEIDAFKSAIELEKDSLCAYCERPDLPLFGRDLIGVRKSVWNEVAGNIFSNLGFSVKRKTQGLPVFFKPLTGNYLIKIECDAPTFLKPFVGSKPRWVYWPLLRIDVCFSLVAATDLKSDLLKFSINNCVAATQRSLYEDSRSLEVAIRANALWYELMVLKFSESIGPKLGGL